MKAGGKTLVVVRAFFSSFESFFHRCPHSFNTSSLLYLRGSDLRSSRSSPQKTVQPLADFFFPPPADAILRKVFQDGLCSTAGHESLLMQQLRKQEASSFSRQAFATLYEEFVGGVLRADERCPCAANLVFPRTVKTFSKCVRFGRSVARLIRSGRPARRQPGTRHTVGQQRCWPS